MSTRVCITGGAGFVGVNLVAALTEHGGYDITVIDDETLGDRRHVEPFGVRYIDSDIRDEAALNAALDGQDAVVHLAANTRVMDSIERPAYNFDVNVVGSYKLLEACRTLGVPRVIAASTGGAILGDAPAPVHEAMVANPLAPYGSSKLAMEGYMSGYAGAFGLKCSALRFSNVYGPRSFHKGSVVAHFYKQILAGETLVVHGDGTQARDFLYVEDLVEGIRKAMESDLSGVFQLGAGRPTTVNELIDLMREVTGRRDIDVHYAPFRAGEIHTTWCNIDKAKDAFGYDPSTPLKDGLAQTWSWFVEQAGQGRAAPKVA